METFKECNILRFLDHFEFKDEDIIYRDVAIIGGGSAGTYAGVKLKDLQQSIIVIEKDVVLGGHPDTYIDKGTVKHANVGVQVSHNIPLVKDYFARLNVPLSSPPSTSAAPIQNVSFLPCSPSNSL